MPCACINANKHHSNKEGAVAQKRNLPNVIGRKDLDPNPTPAAPRPHPFAWQNRWEERRIRSYKGVVDASTELLHSVSENRRALERLRNIDEEIRYDRNALDMHNENLEYEKEKLERDRERDRILWEQERKALHKNGKRKPALPPEAEVEGIDYGEEEE
jgi:hypothetical protein